MVTTFTQLFEQITQATRPEQVFGDLVGDLPTALRRRYRELVTLVHPDQNPGQAAAASQAFQALQHWYSLAQQQLTNGGYGRDPLITIHTRRGQYTGYQPAIAGDVCDLYPASDAAGQVLLKVVRNPRNNDLLAAEAQALRHLARALDGQRVLAHFPTLIEPFRLTDAAGVERHGNVLRYEPGYSSLAEVLRAYPRGIDTADAAWMFNRILAALATTHDQGLVFGALLPAHVLIRPADHNGMLIDWCYSVKIGEALKAISGPNAAEYPPEVPAKQPASPATDLYMAARCLLRLLGGNPQSQALPASVPKPIGALLRSCLLPAPQRRANDAWQLFDDVQKILRSVYGPPVFRPFVMP